MSQPTADDDDGAMTIVVFAVIVELNSTNCLYPRDIYRARSHQSRRAI